MRAQSHALGKRTKFQLYILIINVTSGIAYFREINLENSRSISETTTKIVHSCGTAIFEKNKSLFVVTDLSSFDKVGIISASNRWLDVAIT